jgi:hypothetical protein
MAKERLKEPSLDSPWHLVLYQCASSNLASRKGLDSVDAPPTPVNCCSNLSQGSVDTEVSSIFDRGIIRSSSVAATVVIDDEEGYLSDRWAAEVVIDDDEGYLSDSWLEHASGQ